MLTLTHRLNFPTIDSLLDAVDTASVEQWLAFGYINEWFAVKPPPTSTTDQLQRLARQYGR